MVKSNKKSKKAAQLVVSPFTNPKELTKGNRYMSWKFPLKSSCHKNLKKQKHVRSSRIDQSKNVENTG